MILTLDFGGTKLSAGVTVPGECDWRAFRQVHTPRAADAEYELRAMLALARELLEARMPQAVGVSFGGPVDFESGVVRLSHHVPGWVDLPLRNRLQAELGAPVAVDNDANAGALGEHRYGAGRGCDHLLYVTVSTGVGGGWILEGRPYRGAQGTAGEIGHTVVDPAGPECLCGRRGCVERLASGPYMARDAQAQLRAQPPAQAGLGARGTILRELVGEVADITARDLGDAAEQGDDLAAEILERGARALGVGLGNAANLLNPQRIVLGGGVTKSGGAWWTTVRRAARETTLPEVDVEIVPAELGDDAPLWGAVALAEDLL